MFINISDSKEAANKGSSGALVHYLEKENRLNKKNEPEYWFNGQQIKVDPYEVMKTIDGNIAKLGKADAKFFLINISPSQKEIAFLKEQYGDEEAFESATQRICGGQGNGCLCAELQARWHKEPRRPGMVCQAGKLSLLQL